MKLLLVGWDAADWKVIRPLLENGQMPHLASLMSQGVHGNIATLYPPLSPTLWTSIATGKRPTRHGIHGFIEPTEDGMGVRPITNLGRTTKALWNILHQNGKRSIVVGWWPSHPAEPIRGAMVSNHFPLNSDADPETPMAPGTVHPPELAAELADLRVHPIDITGEMLQLFVPEAARVDQSKDRSLHDLANIVAETLSIHAAATDLMERVEWDLAAVYYSSIDHFSHRFMRDYARKRRRSDGAEEVYAEVVSNAYRYHDVMLGRLLQLAGPECPVILLSDHGFHSDALLPDYIPAEAAGPAVEHRHFGILCMRAPGVKAGAQIYGASVLDITPTVLHLFGLPAGGDMHGKVLMNAFPGQTELPRIPSWDEVPGEDGRHPPNLHYDSAAAAESLKQLVDLGYVAPLGDDQANNVAKAVTENRYNLARACLDAGDLPQAAEILVDLVAQEPEEGRIYMHLIQCRLHQGLIPQARKDLAAFDKACAEFAPRAAKEFERRRAERPDTDLTPEDKAERHERHRLAEKANGHVLERLLLHAEVALAQGRSKAQKEQARAALGELAVMARGSELGMFLARGFAAVGESERALSYIALILREDPERYEALSLRAGIQFALKRYQEAAESAIDSLALVYLQPQTHLVLGTALERLGDPREAEREYRVALAQAPGFARARLALAKLLQHDPARLGEAAQHMAQANLTREQVSKKQDAARAAAEAKLEKETAGVPAAEMQRSAAIWSRGGAAPPQDRSRAITIVSGLPRSGTSMMMQMLVAAGIPPYTDGERVADEDNPRGYLEHRNATLLHKDTSWLPEARGAVVKIVGHLLTHLPGCEEYRIVFMHRDLGEVLASQKAMLQRLRLKGGRLRSPALTHAYTSQLVRIDQWLKRAENVHVLGISYAQAVEAPAETAAKLRAFLGDPFDAERAAASVDPTLRRQKAALESKAS